MATHRGINRTIFAVAFQSVDDEAAGLAGVEWNPDEAKIAEFILEATSFTFAADYEYRLIKTTLPDDVADGNDVTTLSMEGRNEVTEWVDDMIWDWPHVRRIIIPGQEPTNG